MKKLLVCIVLMGFSVAAHAEYIEGQERPVAAAKMVAQEARYGFDGVRRAVLTVTRKNGTGPNLTGMILKFQKPAHVIDGVRYPRENRLVTLAISNVHEDGCGSLHYSASLPGVAPDYAHGAFPQSRFHVELIDHSNRYCRDLVKATWEATVREGFGFCGTGDATMTLLGNPEPLFVTE